MQESLRMSPQRQEVCSTKKLCMLVLIMVSLNVDAVSPPWTRTLVTSLNWSLPFLQDLNYPIKTWIMLLSKSVHKCSMNTSLQLLHNLLLARQECEYTHRKWLTAKWWVTCWNQHRNAPGSLRWHFQWCRSAGRAVDSRALLGWDPSSLFLEGRFEGGLNRVFSASQVEGHIEIVYTNGCRRDKWVTKVDVAVLTLIAALFLSSCSTVLLNS